MGGNKKSGSGGGPKEGGEANYKKSPCAPDSGRSKSDDGGDSAKKGG